MREGRLDPDELLDETGNVPADALYAGFYMQAPTKEIAQYATLLENLWNDEFVDGYQAMAQWSREHVPFPGAARSPDRRGARPEERAHDGADASSAVASIDFTNIRGHVLNAFAEKDNVVPVAAVEPASRLVGHPTRRDELRLGGGHVTFATGSRAFKHTLPRDHGVDRRAQRRARPAEGALMEIRPLEPRDRDAMRALLRARAGGRPHVLQGERRRSEPCSPRGSDPVPDGSIAVDGRRGRRLRRPSCRCTAGRATSASSASIVDPDHRGSGIGRALARHAVLEALELGLTKLVVEVVADQESAIAHVPLARVRPRGAARRITSATSPASCAT